MNVVIMYNKSGTCYNRHRKTREKKEFSEKRITMEWNI